MKSLRPIPIRRAGPAHLMLLWLWLLVVWLAANQGQVVAQVPPSISVEDAVKVVMQPMPPVNYQAPQALTATVEFDPPTVQPGQKTLYRIAIEAPENTIQWPDQLVLPTGLTLTRRIHGQLSQSDGTPFRPLTGYLYELTAAQTGTYQLPGFTLHAGSTLVTVPAATLQVIAQRSPVAENNARIYLDLSETNVYYGQPFRVVVACPAGLGNQLNWLHDVEFLGDSLLVDKTAQRLSVTPYKVDGQIRTATLLESVVTPSVTGINSVAAQAFVLPNANGAGPVIITANGGPVVLNNRPGIPRLEVTEPQTLVVRPLPEAPVRGGFTGSMGKFHLGPVGLSTNTVHVGEPIRLYYQVVGSTNLVRFVPPTAPRSAEWQILSGRPGENVFTLIPLTEEATRTPVIPFSSFDYFAGRYEDLTIPAIPVTVIGDGLPMKLPALEGEDQATKIRSLSDPQAQPGASAANLQPWQLRAGFYLFLLLPVYGLFLLWRWDERRRFWAAHPELWRRREARRALRRLRRELRQARAAANEAVYLELAVQAVQVAVAPHFPATAGALVGADVIAQLAPGDSAGPVGQSVRRIFAAVDRRYAAVNPAPPAPVPATDWPALVAEVELVLQRLEEKL